MTAPARRRQARFLAALEGLTGGILTLTAPDGARLRFGTGGPDAVAMTLDQAGNHGTPLQIGHLRFRPGQFPNLLVGSNGKEFALFDRKRFGDGLSGVESDDLPVNVN